MNGVNFVHHLRTKFVILKRIIGMAKYTHTLCHEFTFFVEFACFRVSIKIFFVTIFVFTHIFKMLFSALWSELYRHFSLLFLKSESFWVIFAFEMICCIHPRDIMIQQVQHPWVLYENRVRELWLWGLYLVKVVGRKHGYPDINPWSFRKHLQPYYYCLFTYTSKWCSSMTND